jgi:LPXTG-site transpeptidase (sortase) family protein
MTKSEAIKFLAVRSLGNFLLLFALYGVVATFGPALYFEAQYQVAQVRGVVFSVSGVSKVSEVSSDAKTDTTDSGGVTFASILAGERQQSITPPDEHFSLVIPKIGASAKVYPNVDPDKESDFLPVLQHGIAHAKGSVFPGMEGNVYLFAHSTDNWWDVGRYNAVFYLLKDLKLGDQITVFFEGQRYDYTVKETIISSPDDISYLTREHSGPEQLVLQTCWPPGTTWKRLLVLASPTKTENL